MPTLTRRPWATPLALGLALSLASSPVVAAEPPAGADAGAEGAEAGAPPSPLALDARAREAFDRGDYRSAADAWARALGAMEENSATHMTRAVMLQNAIISYKQVYVESGERTVLLDAQQLLRAYLGACKRVYRELCDPQDETREARALLEEISSKVDETEDLVPKKMPPEHNTVIGGKPLDVTRDKPPAPRSITLALVGGTVVAAGGAAMIYWGATNPDFKASDDAALAFREEGDTGTDTGTDSGTGTSGGTTSSIPALELSGEAKGKVFIGLGAFALAVGVGFIVLGSIQLAKHRRLNKRETLAITPAVGPGGGGLVVQGRF